LEKEGRWLSARATIFVPKIQYPRGKKKEGKKAVKVSV
jgi:hypothetical protein